MSHRKSSRSQFSADGHKRFENARKPQWGPAARKCKLTDAESCYQKCLECSKTSAERASSYKHLARLSWWAAKDAAKDIWNSGKAESTKRQGGVVDTAESVDKQNEVKERLKKCVEYFLKADYFLKEKESQLCVNDVENWVSEIIEWSSQYLDAHPASFTPVMTVLCEALETSEWSTKCYLKFAVSIFKRGTKCLEIESSSSKVPGQGGYMECMKAMRECEKILQLPCIENIGLEGSVSDLEKVSNLKSRVRRYLLDCKAIQHIIDGEGYLEQGMNGEEGMILKAIECFRSAVHHENSPEYRAFAYSRLGKLYSFREDETKAHHNHQRSVDIACRKLSPQIKTSEWFISSSEAVEKHRLREETRTKVTALQKAAKEDLIPYIEFLSKTFPHPNKGPKLPSSEGLVSELVAWREAMLVYHPDKNKQESEQWQGLCNLIIRELMNKKPSG